MKRFCAVLLVVLAVASVFGEMQIIDWQDSNLQY